MTTCFRPRIAAAVGAVAATTLMLAACNSTCLTSLATSTGHGTHPENRLHDLRWVLRSQGVGIHPPSDYAHAPASAQRPAIHSYSMHCPIFLADPPSSAKKMGHPPRRMGPYNDDAQWWL